MWRQLTGPCMAHFLRRPRHGSTCPLTPRAHRAQRVMLCSPVTFTWASGTGPCEWWLMWQPVATSCPMEPPGTGTGGHLDPGRTQTCNLWFRGPTPYPLGHRATWNQQAQALRSKGMLQWHFMSHAAAANGTGHGSRPATATTRTHVSPDAPRASNPAHGLLFAGDL